MASLQEPLDEVATDTASLGALDQLLGYHLRRASAVFAADFARALEGTGMRQVLFGVLSLVQANPGINQGTVGRILGIQRANMVAPINTLVEMGLIDRRTDPRDRRAFLLELTEKGVATFDDSLRRIREHEKGLVGDLTSDEREMMIDLLGRIERRER